MPENKHGHDVAHSHDKDDHTRLTAGDREFLNELSTLLGEGINAETGHKAKAKLDALIQRAVLTND